jgi:hypothetical protein
MNYLLAFFLLISGCASKPSNEMEEMSRDVLKAKEGIEIKIFPLPKDSPHARMNPRGD